MEHLLKIGAISCLLLARAASAQAEASAEDLMKRLDGVAPAAVLENATLLDVPEEGEPVVVREGTNGWTCMYPGTDPMCADEGALSFFQAYMGKTEPPDTIGFAYMLLGDEGASNVDPFATEETADNNWIVAGPHVMIVGSGAQSMIDSYPHEVPENADTPWVMWGDTPYAHLMIPIK